MRVTPHSLEEIQTMNLLPEGQYSYEVTSAKERISKAGAEMIELQLRVYDQNGREHLVFDYLLDQMKHKLYHFAESHNLLQKYQERYLSAEDLVGKKGFASITIQKDKSGVYGPKNSVKDYIVNVNAKVEATNEFLDDTIPF